MQKIRYLINMADKFFSNQPQLKGTVTTQDLSNIERNKVMKNQPIWIIPRGLAYNNQPGGVKSTPPPCRIGLTNVWNICSWFDDNM